MAGGLGTPRLSIFIVGCSLLCSGHLPPDVLVSLLVAQVWEQLSSLVSSSLLKGFFGLFCPLLFLLREAFEHDDLIALVTVDGKRDDGLGIGLHPSVNVGLGENLRVRHIGGICAISGLPMLHSIFNRIIVMVFLELARLRMEREE